jgi:hypothetical protein
VKDFGVLDFISLGASVLGRILGSGPG